MSIRNDGDQAYVSLKFMSCLGPCVVPPVASVWNRSAIWLFVLYSPILKNTRCFGADVVVEPAQIVVVDIVRAVAGEVVVLQSGAGYVRKWNVVEDVLREPALSRFEGIMLPANGARMALPLASRETENGL